LLGTRLSSIRRKADQVELETMGPHGRETLQTSLLIGADGPDSTVANEFDFPKPGKLLSAHGIEVGGCNLDPDSVRIFTGKAIAPHFFAWVIPTGEETRIGLATDQGNASSYLPALLKRMERLGMQTPEKGVQYVTGTIPIGPRKRTYGERVLLLGDAAGQVKATSGGGIYMGMKCASHAADAALKAMEADDFSEASLAGYQSAWDSDVGKELRTGYQIHRAFSSLTDKDMDDIFKAMNKPQILKIINNVGDIDYPSKLLFSIIMKAPKLLKYAPKGLVTLASQ
jgi:flavin-dependent dehydrogenase